MWVPAWLSAVMGIGEEPHKAPEPPSGWVYHKWGHCSMCDDDDASIFKRLVVDDIHVVFDIPMCRSCAEKENKRIHDDHPTAG